MSFFGLAETTVAVPLRQITRQDLTRDEVELRFARAALTAVGEPGDGVLGALVGALGPVRTLHALLERIGPEPLAAAAGIERDVPPAEIVEAVDRYAPRLKSALALLSLTQAARFGVRLLVPEDAEWPAGMDDLGVHAPLALWVRGDPARLPAMERSIALVGSRAATGYGEHVAMESAGGLVDRGFAVVSGAAYGIDGTAHRAALASGGTTIAFLAGGLDRFYPTGHEALLTRIIETGVAVSEVPCGTPPTRWRFLQRNRLIAAASIATVVLEADYRSGSLNTAGHAAALGRALGAVPGPVTSSTSAGCHRLLRDYAAVCVTNADQMAELAGFDPSQPPDPATGGPGSDGVRVLDALSARSGRPVDDVAARAGLSVAATTAALGTLELDGLVAVGARGWTRRPQRA